VRVCVRLCERVSVHVHICAWARVPTCACACVL